MAGAASHAFERRCSLAYMRDPVVYGGQRSRQLVSRYLTGSVLARLEAHYTTLRYGAVTL